MGARSNGQKISLYEASVPPRNLLGIQRRTLGITRRRTHILVLHDGALLTAGLLKEVLGIQLLVLSGKLGRGAIDHFEGELRFQRGAGAELERRVCRISRRIARRPTLGSWRL